MLEVRCNPPIPLSVFQANSAMRKTKQVLTLSLDLLKETGLVEKVVKESVGLLRTRRFEDDTFIQIPSDLMYHYVTLLVMHSAVISFTKCQVKGTKPLMSIAATIIILCAQCSWPICVDMLKDLFDWLDGDLCIPNAM